MKDEGKMSGTKQTKRIPQLEGLRFIMCCIIILSHFEFLSEKVRQIAIDGNELVRQVKNKTASVINRLIKERKDPSTVA